MPDEGRGARRNRPGDPRRCVRAPRVNLRAANTAIVLDSTADYPEGPERFASWRIVPLSVRFGDESFRDYVELGPDAFYERLRTSPVTPKTAQPTPADFLAVY